MADEKQQKYLSDYERAIFYYTIPRVTSPITVRVVSVYSALLLTAFVILAYGIRTERSDFTMWGTVALGVIIVLGIITFMYHAFANQLAEDKALYAAKNIPDADSQFDDIPDPFSDHLLLSVSRQSGGKQINVVDKKGRPQYILPEGRSGSAVRVNDADGQEVLSLSARSGGAGFTVSRGTPSRITVSKADAVVAHVRRKMNFGPEKVEVIMADESSPDIQILGGGIYTGDKMVGRVYEVRGSVYLDIQKSHFNDGLLAYFLLMA